MSDTNRVRLSYAKHSGRVFPVPGSALTLKQLRTTGTPSLAFDPNTVQSEEIREDRQVADLILVGAEAGGDSGFELSYGAFDDFIESALFSTFTNTPEFKGGTEITAFGAGTITVDDDTPLQVGHVVVLADLATGDQGDGVYEVTALAGANVVTLAPLTAGTNAVVGTWTADADTSLKVAGFKAQANGAVSLTVTGGDAVFSFPAGALDDAMGAAAPLVVGQWIKFEGFTGATANNAWCRIRAIDLAADSLTVDAQTGMATDAAGSARVACYFGDYVRNGTQAIPSHQYLVERRFADHSPVTREVFLGMALNSLRLQLQPRSIMTGTFGFTGFSSDVDTVVANLYENAPNDADAPQFDVYNTSNNIGRLGRGVNAVDAAGVNFVLEATLEINNNLRQRPAVGFLGAVSIGAGEFSVTGNLNTYFDNKDILEEIIGNTETSLDFSVRGNDGRAVLFDMPRVKFNGGAPDVPGKNQDVVINGGYQAIRSKTLGYTLHVQRFPYAA